MRLIRVRLVLFNRNPINDTYTIRDHFEPAERCERVQELAGAGGPSAATTGLNLLHGAKFQRFLSGKSVFLNSKFQIREFHAD